jgi:hypothetical protein
MCDLLASFNLTRLDVELSQYTRHKFITCSKTERNDPTPGMSAVVYIDTRGLRKGQIYKTLCDVKTIHCVFCSHLLRYLWRSRWRLWRSQSSWLWRRIVWYSGSVYEEYFGNHFTKASHLPLFWVRWIQTICFQTPCVYLRPILILSSHPPVRSQTGLFTFKKKTHMCLFSLSHFIHSLLIASFFLKKKHNNNNINEKCKLQSYWLWNSIQSSRMSSSLHPNILIGWYWTFKF